MSELGKREKVQLERKTKISQIMRRLIVFIGLCLGCWNHQQATDELETEKLAEEEKVQVEAQKQVDEFRKTDHCFDFVDHTKVYTGMVL